MIPREHAICIFFGEPYNPSVGCFYLTHIDEFGLLEICCEISKPHNPLLLAKQKIYSNPKKYLVYPHVSNFQFYENHVIF